MAVYNKWVSMAFLLPDPPTPGVPNGVGLVFSDDAHARKIFDLLRSWNHGGDVDSENNIQLSFITDEDRYYVLLSPHFDMAAQRQFFERVEHLSRFEKYGKEHFGLSMRLTLCKPFST